jgi:hypothetical protein
MKARNVEIRDRASGAFAATNFQAAAISLLTKLSHATLWEQRTMTSYRRTTANGQARSQSSFHFLVLVCRMLTNTMCRSIQIFAHFNLILLLTLQRFVQIESGRYQRQMTESLRRIA